MAQRLVFTVSEAVGDRAYDEELVDFQYYGGFALSQKRKCIQSLHDSYHICHPNTRILEVSSKSEAELGRQLSAFNLRFTDEDAGAVYPLENVFQSSKVYEHGGPYRELLQVLPKEAKKDPRHGGSGKPRYFQWGEWKCALEPKSMFYDWVYCKALSQHPQLVECLLAESYTAFTDIEFNHKKSINCQARAAAIYVSLSNRDQLEEYLADKDQWRTIYGSKI